MTGGNASVLTTVLKMIDKYDLYGLVAYPKAFKRVVIFFFGSGLDKAKIIGLWGFVRNRMTCQRMLAMRQR
jgi:hypothetical protein